MDELLKSLIEYVGDEYSIEQKSLLQTLINDAVDEVACEMYPYGFTTDAEEQNIRSRALKKYKSKIRRIAEYHFDKIGREGTLSWSESGASVNYESAGTPNSYLKGIIPIAKII